jgi:glycosyltransferase involved in cell wall biosynthesis
MDNTVLIVDPRSVIIGDQNAFARHKIYADTLKKLTNGQLSLSILSFSKCKIPRREISGNLVLYRIPRNPFYAFKVFCTPIKSIMANTQVKLVVAGDPWESLAVARIVRMGLKVNASIQVQVHGDIGNIKWIQANIRNWLRSRITFLTLRFADQIRSVSETQSKNLVDTYKVPRSSLVVIPVPSFFPIADSVEESNFSRPRTIGFVGRIQNDRGLSLFLQLISKLSSEDSDFSVVVAGDGNKRKDFQVQLETIVGKSRLKFLDHLTKKEMVQCWSQIGVLASTAPSESFGRTLRESLVSGVPVWATPSSGVNDLRELVEKHEVQLININLSGAALVQDFKEMLELKVSQKTRTMLRELDNDSLVKLISSWRSLCNR